MITNHIRNTSVIAVALFAACQQQEPALEEGTPSSSIVTECDERLALQIDEQLAPGIAHEIELELRPDDHGEFRGVHDVIVGRDLAVGVEIALDPATVEQWLAKGARSVVVKFDTARLDALVTPEHNLFGDDTTPMLPLAALGGVLASDGLVFCGTRRVIGKGIFETDLGKVPGIVALHGVRDILLAIFGVSDCPLSTAGGSCDGKCVFTVDIPGIFEAKFPGECMPGQSWWNSWLCYCNPA